MKMKLLLGTAAGYLASTGLVQAATQEEFNNLVGAVPYISFMVILGIALLTIFFKIGKATSKQK